MADLTINGNEYKTGKLDAIRQFHVARRLAPVLQSLGVSVTAGGDPLAALAPVAEALSHMSDAESEYVLFACLDVCQRKQDTGWARVRSSGGMMFSDMGLPEIVQLAVAVLQENLGGFFAGALGNGAAPTSA